MSKLTPISTDIKSNKTSGVADTAAKKRVEKDSTASVMNPESKKISKRSAVFTLCSRISAVVKMPLEKAGIFSKDEKTLDNIIKYEAFISTHYSDVKIETKNLKTGIDQKAIHNLKLKLAELEIPADKAKQIVELYASKESKIEFNKAELKKILSEDVSDKNIDLILKSPKEQFTIRKILGNLVNRNLIGKKTAIIIDTTYRLGTKLLATGVFLAGVAITATAVATAIGVSIPTGVAVGVAVIVVAAAILAVTAVVITEGIEAYNAAEAAKQKAKSDVDQLDEETAKTSAEKFSNLLAQGFELFTQLQKLLADDDIQGEVTDAVTNDFINPFKKLLEQLFGKASSQTAAS